MANTPAAKASLNGYGVKPALSTLPPKTQAENTPD